ncbi:MAG: hypothetical protein U5K69_16550 [Balneolaceae bacterium]|nr:hypothetical protein [Balneolaceae bacterium]
MLGVINSNSFINKIWTDLESSEKFSFLTDKLSETFWKEKPTLSFETYHEARSLLQHEYSYWRLKDSEIDKYWRYQSI